MAVFAQVVVRFEGKGSSLEEFAQRIYRLANALTSLGLKQGDAVGFLLPHNMIEGQEIIFALAVTGIIIVPLNACGPTLDVAGCSDGSVLG